LNYFKTQGDNNGSPDPPYDVEYPIPESKVLGVVIGRVPYIGYIKIFLTESGLGIPIIIILGVMLLISIAYDLIQSTKEKDETEQEETEKQFDKQDIDMGI